MLLVLALFYINWYPGKRSAPADGNGGSDPKKPRKECELRFTCIPSHNPVLFSCLCTNFALANPTIYSLYGPVGSSLGVGRLIDQSRHAAEDSEIKARSANHSARSFSPSFSAIRVGSRGTFVL